MRRNCSDPAAACGAFRRFQQFPVCIRNFRVQPSLTHGQDRLPRSVLTVRAASRVRPEQVWRTGRWLIEQPSSCLSAPPYVCKSASGSAALEVGGRPLWRSKGVLRRHRREIFDVRHPETDFRVSLHETDVKTFRVESNRTGLLHLEHEHARPSSLQVPSSRSRRLDQQLRVEGTKFPASDGEQHDMMGSVQ